MSGENMNVAELYRQLCLAANEYSSFRCNMVSSPVVTPQQIELAIKKADRVVAFLRMLQARQKLEAASVPEVAAPPQPAPPAPPPVAPVYPDGTVLGIGKDGLPPGAPPCSAWECSGCHEILWVIGATRPVRCPCCGVAFQFPG
jgi:hypothetical protein